MNRILQICLFLIASPLWAVESYREILVREQPLAPIFGSNEPYGEYVVENYVHHKKESQLKPTYPVQWMLADLDTGKPIAHSKGTSFNFYGASVTKLYVAAAFLDKFSQRLRKKDLQHLADLIVISSNTSWQYLQDRLARSKDHAMRAVWSFTKGLGIVNTVPFRGWLGRIHGNETNVLDVTKFLLALHKGQFKGHQVLTQLMNRSRTGDLRGKKYLPESLLVGGKTGSYKGPTAFPIQPVYKVPGRKKYLAKSCHHAMIFSQHGKNYGLVILSDLGDEEVVAAMSFGLYREYIAKSKMAATSHGEPTY